LKIIFKLNDFFPGEKFFLQFLSETNFTRYLYLKSHGRSCDLLFVVPTGLEADRGITGEGKIDFQTAFGKTPEAWVLGIRGYQFDELVEGLTDKARANLDEAEKFLKRFLVAQGEPTPAGLADA